MIHIGVGLERHYDMGYTRRPQALLLCDAGNATFPTQYQLEQLGKLVLIDRTRPYMLDKYFDADHFMVIKKPLTQVELFARICGQLETEDLVESGFRASLQERERIVFTILGEGIALPPQGIDWGNGENATLIFVLATSKADYEEVMGLYDLFLALMNEKASRDLLVCRDFAGFKALARTGS